MTKARECMIAASIAAMACVALSMSAFAQGPLPGQPEFGKLLVEAAQASPGCLGVKLGRTGDGTNVISESELRPRTAAGCAGEQRANSRSCHVETGRQGSAGLADPDRYDRH